MIVGDPPAGYEKARHSSVTEPEIKSSRLREKDPLLQNENGVVSCHC
jgi:hypothetical protein